jgi:hypothetical protein
MPPSTNPGKPKEAVLLRATLIGFFIASIALSPCAQESVSIPAGLPARVLPGMDMEVEILGAPSVARDALDPPTLERLLEDGGYVSGRQQLFSGAGERFSLAIARVLVFGSPAGAGRYVEWLRTHPEDLLGTAEMLDPLDLPGSPFLMVHRPTGCCPKEVPIYLSAWRRGATVLFLRASGRSTDVAAVQDLAVELDLAAEGAGA